jgi:hypothetical protein
MRERALAVSCAAEPGISPARGRDKRIDGGGMNTCAANTAHCSSDVLAKAFTSIDSISRSVGFENRAF